MIKLNTNIKILEGGKCPEYMTKEAAAADCYVRDVSVTPISKFISLVTYSLGFALELMPGFNIHLFARSSAFKKNHILSNGVGIGDPDYRGEYKAVFYVLHNEEDNVDLYKVGERCCQIQVNSYYQINFTEVSSLDNTDREGGFGSTGN